MRKHILKSIGAIAMAAAMATTMMVSVSAASEDIIDTSKTGSLTIHKYDLTAAQAAGIDVSGYQNNGEVDAEAAAERDKRRWCYHQFWHRTRQDVVRCVWRCKEGNYSDENQCSIPSFYQRRHP